MRFSVRLPPRMRFSVRRLHVCPAQEKRTLRKDAFCAGTLTERRILCRHPHGKAHPGPATSRKSALWTRSAPHGKVHPAPHALRVTVPYPACRTLRVPRYAPLPCALLGMHCDVGDNAVDPPRSRYPTPAGYTNHHGNSMVYCLDVWARSIVLRIGGHTRWRALALACSDLF